MEKNEVSARIHKDKYGIRVYVSGFGISYHVDYKKTEETEAKDYADYTSSIKSRTELVRWSS